ncbi:VENN motif pre-toxin domain-containing protein, partial [Providencia rettgeri]|nr:VENN motif pre-toxin domain-containing protein [Providencia rettgeri]
HGIANVALALAKGENAGAQSLGAMTGEAMGMLSQELYKKDVSQLTEDEKATVSAFASLAAGIAGGLVGGDTSSAGNAAEAGKTTVENNYLSDSEHRQKTSLELKEKQGKITEVEQQKLAELRIKDTETTQRLLDTCAGGVSPECTAARKDAFETIDTYVSLTYQNPKTAQAGYQDKKDVSQLTEDEKATVSAFASLAAGIAGGLVGGDTSNAGNAAEAGKTTVENNFLHAEKIITFVGEFANAKTPEEKKQLQQDIDKLDKKLQSQAEGWGISTNDMRSALAGLKALEGLPDCNVQCQEMVRDSISKLEPALENRINNHSSQTENLKELTGILATVIVMNESGLIDGVSKGNNTSSVTKPNVTTKPNEQIPPKTVPNQTGGDKLGNYQVHDLKQVTDPALNLNVIRQETKDYLKLGAQKDNSAVSYATASVTVNGKTEYYLSVSGKSWSGQSPDTVNISGINYKVIRDDKNSFTSVGDIEAKRTNFNHAEQKLFNHIQDSYKGQKAEVNMAIQNTSQNKQGMCVSCGYTSQNFAENNKNLKVNIYQGSTGENK